MEWGDCAMGVELKGSARGAQSGVQHGTQNHEQNGVQQQANKQQANMNEFGEEDSQNHPSLKKEDVSGAALLERFAPKKLKTNTLLASAVAFGVINAWFFAALFQPNAFVFDSASFLQLTLFQDISFAFFLISLIATVVLQNVTEQAWFKTGAIFLVVSPLWICLYMTASLLGAPKLALMVMTFLAHMLFGLSLGIAFCNWVRFFAKFQSDTPLQIGIAIILSAICVAVVFVSPGLVKTVIVTLFPLVIMAALFHLRTVVSEVTNARSCVVIEKPEHIKADRGLWISVSMVGLVYGFCFGFAISDYPVMQLSSVVCDVVMCAIGIVIAAYFLKSGKNLGYTTTAASLLAFITAGQGLLSIFEHEYLAITFSLLYIGQFFFEMVLLLQLPSVYVRKRSLRTFFALQIAFFGFQYLGMIMRNFLALGLPEVAFRFLSAALLCLAIVSMAITLHDTSVSSVWGLFPIPTYPKKKYSRACNLIKEQYLLTPRETEIMMMVGRGRNGTFIQEKLLISKSTYQTHMRNLYKKLDIHSDQELIDYIEFAMEELKLE
jgi:DNA-binding CsgD family transcriptional regulator